MTQMALLLRSSSLSSLRSPLSSSLRSHPIPTILRSNTWSSRATPRIASIYPPSNCDGRHSFHRAFGSCSNSGPVVSGDTTSLCSRIFIKGLPCSTSEGHLSRMFSCFGEIKRVKIITSKTPKQSLGFAYIWFACEEDAQLAVKEMDGKFVDGRFIIVTMARPESPTSQVRATPYKF